MGETKRGPGRPFIEINKEELEKLAAMNCTMKEMAAFFDCSVDTLERNYADVIDKGREMGKMSLRRMQYQAAQKGNVVMMIWLGKQLLGQREMKDVQMNSASTHVFLSPEEAKKELQGLKDMLKEEIEG